MIQNTAFNIFDIFIISVIIISTIIGFFRGFIREVLGLSAWAGAFYLCIQKYEFPINLLKEYIKNEKILNIVSKGILFILFLILFLFIAHLISRMVRHTFIKCLDSFLGSIFGFIKSIVFICIGYLAIVLFLSKEKHPEIILVSKSITHIQKGALLIQKYLPEELSKKNLMIIEKSVENILDNTQNIDEFAKELEK